MTWGISLLALLIAGLAPAAPAAANGALPDKLEGHGGPIMAVSVSADGSEALSASFDYSLIHWTLGSGKIIQRLQGHLAAANDVAFVPGEAKAVSVGDDGLVIFWDLASGEITAKVEASTQKILDVSVSPDGRFAAAAVWDGTARLYDIATGAEVARLSGHKGNVNAVAFSPDSTVLYTAAHDGTILSWSVYDGRQQQKLVRHGWGINVLAVTADQVLFGAIDGTMAAVQPDTLARIDLAKSERPILSLKVAQNGRLAGFGDGTGSVKIFDAQTLELLQEGPVTYGPVWDFDFVPGTAQLYHVGLDDFIARWQIAPAKRAQIQTQLPRRFQVRDSEDPGELEFQRKCSVCHTLTADDGNRAGPTLFQVFGRRAGTLPGYLYSEALLNSDIIWTEETIAALFDDGPDVLLPGTKMPIQRLKSIERRDELIRYLKEATQAE